VDLTLVGNDARYTTLEDYTMPKLVVLYPPPADVTTFERRYHSEHAPMVVQKEPGLKKFRN
jgi:hypothetical protein